MTLITTGAGDTGSAAAEAIREIAYRIIADANISTYIEAESPLSWEAFSDAGWDLAGVVDEDDPDASASLRDLAEIAMAWGRNPVQLPLLTSIIAKRHSLVAAEFDGPVTFGIHTQTLAPGVAYVPFGAVPGIRLVTSFTEADAPLGEPVGVEADDFAPSLRASRMPGLTRFSAEAARELTVVWAAESAGIARRVLDDSVAFAKQREQFGRPIGSFQAVKHHLANAHIATEQATSATIWASLDESASQNASLHAIDQATRAVELGIQVHGGLGFTWEMGLHFYLRHLTMLRELVSGLADH